MTFEKLFGPIVHRYSIVNTVSGVELGIFEGKTEAEALDAMARDAGYRDYAECCEVAPVKPGEIVVTPVPPRKLRIEPLPPEPVAAPEIGAGKRKPSTWRERYEASRREYLREREGGKGEGKSEDGDAS